MAVAHINATVRTTATPIVQLPTGLPYTAVQICNGDTQSIWIGDATITTTGATKGTVITAGSVFTIWLHAGDVLYGISAAGTAAGAVTAVYSGI
jgi:hypothetical protein